MISKAQANSTGGMDRFGNHLRAATTKVCLLQKDGTFNMAEDLLDIKSGPTGFRLSENVDFISGAYSIQKLHNQLGPAL